MTHPLVISLNRATFDKEMCINERNIDQKQIR